MVNNYVRQWHMKKSHSDWCLAQWLQFYYGLQSLLKLSYPSISLGSRVATTLTGREYCDNYGSGHQKNESHFILEVLSHFLDMTWHANKSVTSHTTEQCSLTPLAKYALTNIFFESKMSPSGMMESNIEQYLNVCRTRNTLFVKQDFLKIKDCGAKVLFW